MSEHIPRPRRHVRVFLEGEIRELDENDAILNEYENGYDYMNYIRLSRPLGAGALFLWESENQPFADTLRELGYPRLIRAYPPEHVVERYIEHQVEDVLGRELDSNAGGELDE